MRRCWWTVWIEVAILAALLFLGFRFVSDQVQMLLDPYLIEEDEIGDRTDNVIKDLVEKAEEKLNIRIDYENMIFDYANKYANTMMDQSREERKPVNEGFTIVEQIGTEEEETEATETDSEESQTEESETEASDSAD